MSSLISIITPTFNHENYIGDCIKSVLAQTCQDWEMLIVDDGSTDKTWEIVESYAGKDSRIKAFRQENKGIWRLAETYNFALEQAEGDYIAILEGDDYWPVNKLEIQLAFHNENPELILSHGKTLIVKDKQIIGEYPRPPFPGTLATTSYLRLSYLSESCIMPVSVIISKQHLKMISGFKQYEDYPAVDYTTWLDLFNLQGDVVWTDTVLGYWRQSATQVTQTLGLSLALANLEVALYHFNSLPSSISEHLDLNSKDIIKAKYKANILPCYVECVRISLLEKDRKSTFKYAWQLIKHGSVKRKLQGIYSAIAVLVGWNMEPILSTYAKLVLRRSV